MKDGGRSMALKRAHDPADEDRTRHMNSNEQLLGPLARGILAGAVGTIAMTLSERLEMAVTGRAGSTVPGEVAAHLVPGRDP